MRSGIAAHGHSDQVEPGGTRGRLPLVPTANAKRKVACAGRQGARTHHGDPAAHASTSCAKAQQRKTAAQRRPQGKTGATIA